MSLSNDEVIDRLRTRIVDFRKDEFKKSGFVDLRRSRIQEAVSWDAGPSPQNPKTHTVDTLPTGDEAYFLKPGKEAERNDPNPNDMSPRVDDYYDDYRFSDIWGRISEMEYADPDRYKQFLVLTYRNAYLLDHEEVEDGKIRYRPDPEVVSVVNEGLGNTVPGNIMAFLHFLDLLGWNEDVKYHHSKNKDLSSSFNTGRINTICSCIEIPYKLTEFIDDIRENIDSLEEMDMSKGVESMQNLSSGRGVSKPSNKELKEWFPEMLYE